MYHIFNLFLFMMKKVAKSLPPKVDFSAHLLRTNRLIVKLLIYLKT